MGYKILDVKADIHEDIEKYFMNTYFDEINIEDILDIIDEHFEKIERWKLTPITHDHTTFNSLL